MSIPITDFANFAVLPPLMRRTELVRFNSYIPPYNYFPLRKVSQGLLNISGFGEFGDRENFVNLVNKIVEWTGGISDAKKRGTQIRLNLTAMRAFYDFCENHAVYGIKENFGRFLYTQEGGIRPFEESVIFVDGQPYLIFCDMRASNFLSDLGRKFIFSVQHHHIRERFPDLSDINLAILHLTKRSDKRIVKLLVHKEDQSLFSLSELEAMVASMFDEIRFSAHG